MRIAVLGATGKTGTQLVTQALARGHEVVALGRDPARLQHGSLSSSSSPSLTRVRVDVYRPDELRAALAGVDALVSGLGNVGGQPAGVLTTGARAVVDAGVPRLVWLGAVGTGATRSVGGPLLAILLPLVLRADLDDKVAAETRLRAAGASIVHAGPLGDGGARGGGVLLAPAALPRALWPRTIARADVAALMLDEAEHPRFGGGTGVAFVPKQRSV